MIFVYLFVILAVFVGVLLFLRRFISGRVPLAFGLIGFLYTGIKGTFSILNSSSSTAGIGFIFLPVGAFITGIIFLVAGILISRFLQADSKKAPKPIIFLTLGTLIIGYFLAGEAQSMFLASKVGSVRSMNVTELDQFMQTHPTNQWILAAVTQNPNVTSEILHQIALVDNPQLHEKMWHNNATVVGSNRKGLATMRLVALNSKASTKTLAVLAKSKNKYVLNSVISRPHLPAEILQDLYKQHKGEDLIESGLARNKNTPAYIIADIVHTTSKYTQIAALKHPRFSIGMLNIEQPKLGTLLAAIRLKRTDLVKTFLQRGLDMKDPKNHEALKECVSGSIPEICKILIDRGADVNGRYTPNLNWAIYNKDIPMIKLLLEHGADPHRSAGFGFQTPLETAKDHKLHDVVKLMEQY